jgi:hypothetical protein
MKHRYRRTLGLAGLAAVLLTAIAPVWAGRVERGNDPGFELTRIISAFRGRTSEAIAPWETVPSQPIQGETLLLGQSNAFPEGVKVETFRSSQGWRTLVSGTDFTFKATVATPEGGQGAFSTVAIRFTADKVALIQDAVVRVTIQPMPPVDANWDVIESVTLRSPR